MTGDHERLEQLLDRAMRNVELRALDLPVPEPETSTNNRRPFALVAAAAIVAVGGAALWSTIRPVAVTELDATGGVDDPPAAIDDGQGEAAPSDELTTEPPLSETDSAPNDSALDSSLLDDGALDVDVDAPPADGAEPDPQGEQTEEAEPIPDDAMFIATDGDDGDGDGSARKPFATVAGAVDALGSDLEPGSTLVVRGGTYRITEPQRITVNGTADAPITIINHPGERATISGAGIDGDDDRFRSHPILHLLKSSHVRVVGLDLADGIANAVTVEKSQAIELTGLTISGMTDGGVSAFRSTDLVLRNNNISDIGLGWAGDPGSPRGISIFQRAGDGPCSNIVIADNVVTKVWGRGILVAGCDAVTIGGNRVSDTYDANIALSHVVDAVVDGNVTWTTNATRDRNGQPAQGITVNNSESSDNYRALENITIVNNLSVNNRQGVRVFLYEWDTPPDGDAGRREATYRNLVVAHNTIVEPSIAGIDAIAVGPAADRPSDNRLMNNIIVSSDAEVEPIRLGDSGPGVWLVSHTVVSGENIDEDLGAASTIVAAPEFVGGRFRVGSPVDPDDYRVASGSALIGTGLPAGDQGDRPVTDDFFDRTRSATAPTPGMHEPG